MGDGEAGSREPGLGAGHDGPDLAGGGSTATLPPEWVRLADLGTWISQRYGRDDPGIVAAFKLFLRSRTRHAAVRYRIGAPLPDDPRLRLLAGLEVDFFRGQRIAVARDWEAAHADFDLGIVVRPAGRGGKRYTVAIQVLWADVEHWLANELRQIDSEAERCLPSKSATEDSEASPYRSGVQGRPTSISLIASELERRRKAGEVLTTQASEAQALAAWLAQAHPEAPKAGVKAIGNTLRPKLRTAVSEAKARKDPLE